MRLWADVYTNDWSARRGDGAITTIRSATVNDVLDGVGTISIDVPLTDKRAAELLDNEARFILYGEFRGAAREITRGIVRNRRLSVGDSNNLTLNCVSDLDELKRVNCLLAKIYTTNTAAIILFDLMAGVPGWAASVTGGSALMSARFDGVSVFKALQEITSQQGLHIRRGLTTRSIEFGAFGSSAGVRLVKPHYVTPEAIEDSSIAFVDSISIEDDSGEVVNWIVPIGQGEGESALTLRYSNRVSPYPIQSGTFNGRTHYYLSDTASIAEFGTIQRVPTFKNIAAVSNSDADLQAASNALYDAAAAWLARNSVQLTSYTVTVKKLDRVIRPGDKVRLTYEGVVSRESVPYTYVDIDAEFWVMAVREQYSGNGSLVTLTLNSIDRQALDPAQVVIGALDEINIRNLRVQTYANVRSFVYRREIANGFPAVVPIKLTNVTTALQRALVRVTSRPFRSTASGAASGGGTSVTSASGGSSTPTSAAGGDHNHKLGNIAFYGALGTALPGGAALYTVTFLENDGTNVNFFIPATGVTDTEFRTFTSSGTHTHTITIPSHTHNVTVPDHTHAQVYGISDDTLTPVTISAFIDGVDRTAALGGSWAPAGGVQTFEINITQFLVTAAGGLRSDHTLEFRCASGQGEIEVTVELYETIQAIAVT